MKPLVDWVMRQAYRVAYPLAVAVWWVTNRQVVGVYVAIWHGDRVLMIRNSYKRSFGFPGGMIDAGETPIQAGARELREEAGVVIDPAQLTLVHTITADSKRQRAVAYVVEASVASEPAVHIDHREIVWGAFVPLAEARTLQLAPGLGTYLAQVAAARGGAGPLASAH